MSYNNPQQSLYGSALSPAASAHYGSSNHGGAQYPGGGGGGQQWPGGPQQQLGSSPTPSPAHTPPAATTQYHHHHRQWPAQGPATGAQGPPGYYPRGAGPGPMPQHAHVGGAWAKSGHGHGQPGVGVGVGAAGATGPLFSLQLLVNQEMNRAALASAAAAGVGVPVAGSPGAGVPPSHQHQQPMPSVVAEGSVDLSADSYRRPLPLTHRPQQSQLQQQPLPLNGEVSKDTVSVIAQTPRKPAMPTQLTPMSPATLEPSRPSPDIAPDRGGGAAVSGDKHEPAAAPASTSPSVPNVSSGSAVMAPTTASAPAPAHTPTPPPPESPASRHSDDSHQLPPPGVQQQQQPQPRPSPSPSPAPVSSKDLGPVSPVRSPKSGAIKRTKKVDSILENLVESGTKKGSTQSSGPGSEQSPQPPVSTVVVAPASVIVSPAVTSEDSGGGRDAQSPSPGDSAVPQQPASRAHEDGATSPTFNGSTDEDNGKPRRKRKLDKPVRVAKTSSDTESNSSSSKAAGSEEIVTASVDIPDSSEKLKEVVKIEPVVTGSETVTKLTGLRSDNSESEMKREEDSKPAEKEITKEVEKNITSAPSENTECVESSVKNESVSQKNDNADDLLSVLNSDNGKSEPKLESKNTIIDVETELEKMFAGIVEEDISSDTVKAEVTSSSVTDPSTMAVKALECLSSSENALPSLTTPPAPLPPPQQTKPRISKRGRPKGSRNSSQTFPGLSSSENTPKKKKRKQGGRGSGVGDEGFSSHKKKVKRPKLETGTTCDSPIPLAGGRRRGRDAVSGVATDSGSNASSGRSRGPVVHLEGPRDSPYSVTVVNGPARLDDDEGNDRKASTVSSRRKNSSYHNDLEYRGKGGGGLFNSTLSARYDAHTTDPTWICVFCKRGPHSALGSGDLFGPYLVSRPERELPASADEKDIVEEQSRGGSGTRGKRSLRTAHMVEHFHQKMSKKAKRSHSVDGNAAVAGMTPVGKDDGCYEVWTHEECAVWAAGVHLVGTRIVGLQEAVWGAVRTTCTKCGEGGASLGCVRRGCDLRAHYGCAQDMGWFLEEENYVAKCTQHKITSKGR